MLILSLALELGIYMQKISILIALAFILLSCSQNEEETPKNFSYIIVNTSAVNVGVKLQRAPSASGYLIRSDTFKLGANQEIEFLKAEQQLNVRDFVTSIQIMDQSFKIAYKTLDLNQSAIDGNTYKIFLWLPYPAAKAIVNNYARPVRVEIDQEFISGYYPASSSQYIYFKTSDDFKNIKNIAMPTGMTDVGTIHKSGNTIIASNLNVYSDKIKYIISQDNGDSWSELLTFTNGFGEYFLTTEFINVNEGWLFKYRDWKYTDIYKIVGSSFTKMSSITGYCVKDFEFISSASGYAIANKSDNVSPSTGPGTYFFKTTDGGATWQSPIVIDALATPVEIFAFPSGRIIAIVFTSTLSKRICYISNDDGATWTQQTLAIEGILFDMQFVTPSLGFLKTAAYGDLYSGPVYKTVDEGKTWTKLSEQNVIGTTIKFYNESIGYSQHVRYEEGQFLYVTRDGGLSWKEVLYPYSYMK
jgi:hypothetical protein